MEDIALLEAWRQGDDQAGHTIVRRHVRSLHRFFDSKVPDVAEDLIQDTFLACVRSSAAIKGESLRPYLFGIARNKLLMYWRGAARRPRHASKDVAELSLADLGASPSSFAHARGEQKRLLLALRRLPLDAQIALELKFWEGMTAEAIAQVLGCATVTARRRLKAALAQLEVYLGEPGTADAFTQTARDLERWRADVKAAADAKQRDAPDT